MTAKQNTNIGKQISKTIKKYQSVKEDIKKDNYIFVTPNFGNVPTRMPEKTKDNINAQSMQYYFYGN